MLKYFGHMNDMTSHCLSLSVCLSVCLSVLCFYLQQCSLELWLP